MLYGWGRNLLKVSLFCIFRVFVFNLSKVFRKSNKGSGNELLLKDMNSRKKYLFHKCHNYWAGKALAITMKQPKWNSKTNSDKVLKWRRRQIGEECQGKELNQRETDCTLLSGYLRLYWICPSAWCRYIYLHRNRRYKKPCITLGTDKCRKTFEGVER